MARARLTGGDCRTAFAENPLSGARAKAVAAVGQVQPHGGAGGIGVLALDGVEDRFMLQIGHLRQFSQVGLAPFGIVPAPLVAAARAAASSLF